MPLEPRFRRVAALNRRFVDREAIRLAFAEELQRMGSGPRVFNVVGVGGIGKSRLLRELQDGCPDGVRTAVLDLQIPALRQQEDALAVMRVALGRQGVRFDRFDIAYAVLWQRLHPHLQLSRADLPFVQESEVLTQILDVAGGGGMFGTALSLLRVLEMARGGVKKWHRIRSDATLKQLDHLPSSELIDSVTFLFSEDLRAASTDRLYVLFVDAYDALVPSPLRSGRALMADVWLRDLSVQLDRGLLVIASREPLGWQNLDREWEALIRCHRVDELPMAARLELLAECGVTKPSEQQAIAHASAGVPFYLHLAVDTRLAAASASTGGIVSSEEILQRFLQNVSSREIKTLELLSMARIFDFAIFQALADSFDLPRDRMTWESLTAYSFIYPAGSDGLRLHQLMREALRERLSAQVARDVAKVLQGVWEQRAAQSSGSTHEGIGTRARALREVVYCGLQTGTITGDQILALADQALQEGGKQSFDGVLQDVQNYLNLAPVGAHPMWAETALCLEAEAAILLGDADRAREVTRDANWSLDTGPGARLAIADAHGHRIGGDTAVADRIYRQVWSGHQGPSRNTAGLWVADLAMCQGDFRAAFGLAGQILADCRADDFIMRGDVVLLTHRAYRFSIDFDASAQALGEAARMYEAASSTIGLASIATNRAELLALSDPATAIEAAGKAIDLQRELGALHELGKACTALAIARLQLGKYAESATAFQAACEALEKAKYRSGRARAELFRAVLHLRTGRLDQAIASARWAISELLAAQVYPTLIIMAARVLCHLGVDDVDVNTAAHQARDQLRPLDSVEALESRMSIVLTVLLGEAP